MASNHYFETPENIKISYKPAGLATRYVAFFLDSLIVGILVFLTFLLLVALGMLSSATLSEGPFLNNSANNSGDNFERFFFYFIGIATLVWGLGSFFYFGFTEYFLNGQTPGKKMCKIRVVQSNGFSLNPTSIFIRSVFRMIDQIPVLWIVPLVSESSQRFGDMVAGTIVIAEVQETVSSVRTKISAQSSANHKFRFDAVKLKKLKPQEYSKIETFLERYKNLSPDNQTLFLNQILTPITQIMKTELPVEEERILFLQDLLAAEYKRQSRLLG